MACSSKRMGTWTRDFPSFLPLLFIPCKSIQTSDLAHSDTQQRRALCYWLQRAKLNLHSEYFYWGEPDAYTSQGLDKHESTQDWFCVYASLTVGRFELWCTPYTRSLHHGNNLPEWAIDDLLMIAPRDEILTYCLKLSVLDAVLDTGLSVHNDSFFIRTFWDAGERKKIVKCLNCRWKPS